MSRKIQVVLDDKIAQEVDAVVEKRRFGNQSEFIRQLVRDYLNSSAPTGSRTEMAEIATMFSENQFAQA